MVGQYRTPAQLRSIRDGFTRLVSLSNPPTLSKPIDDTRVEWRKIGGDKIYAESFATLGSSPLGRVRIDDLEWRELP